MKEWRTILVWTIVSYSLTGGVEFDRDSCHSLLPHRKLHAVEKDNGGGAPKHHRHIHEDDDSEENDDDDHDNDEPEHDSDEDDMYNLKPGQYGNSPFKIIVSTGQYRRNRPLEVTIKGGEFNGFILQARSTSSPTSPPVGTFRNAPASVKLLDCTAHDDTAVSKDTGGKATLHFQWIAPDENNGSIVFIGTFVQKEIYWPAVKSQLLSFNQFPPSTAGCGRERSCYRYSSTAHDCSPDKCEYMVITRTTENNEIEFTIGGIVKGNSGYVGIGFTLDSARMSYMDVSICVKDGTTVETYQFLVQEWNGGPLIRNKDLEKEETNLDGESIWCQYRRPLHGPGPQMADLRQSLFHVYLWGQWNDTAKVPILPPVSDVVLVTEAWNHSNTLNVMHFVGGKATSPAGTYIALILSVLCALILAEL